MGDFWRVSDFDAALNDNKGTSAVLLNNPKGAALFGALQEQMPVVKEVPLQIAVSGNHCIERLIHSIKIGNPSLNSSINYPLQH